MHAMAGSFTTLYGEFQQQMLLVSLKEIYGYVALVAVLILLVILTSDYRHGIGTRITRMLRLTQVGRHVRIMDFLGRSVFGSFGQYDMAASQRKGDYLFLSLAASRLSCSASWAFSRACSSRAVLLRTSFSYFSTSLRIESIRR